MTKTKKIAMVIAAMMFAPSAFAVEITPYVGLGIVADKAGTSAKRVKFDATKINPENLATIGDAFIPNGGDDMDFDMAFAGEITAGVKIDNVRAELEVALRSASEDDYDIFDGDIAPLIIPGASPVGFELMPTEIETSTKVRHNSYLANVWYDFELANSNWTPYIGAGVGFGVYRQKATVDIEIDQLALKQFIDDNKGLPAVGPIIAQLGNTLKNIPLGERTVADDTLYRFEWQVGLGAAYNFNENWALDIGYRFNSSNVADEFVYAHEIKVGARYSF